MILDELVLENFGPYLTEQRISLAPPSENKPVVLIGALNGAGKTSILDALQLVLYGRFAACSGRGTLGYDAFLRRCINRSSDPAVGARVELQFRHTSQGAEQSYRVRRSWSEVSGGMRERVEVFFNGDLDRVLTENWETQVETFLPRRIAPLFFFDGEKIEALADPNRSAELLSVAIHSLLGVDVVEQLGADLVILERRKRVPGRDSELERRVESARTELALANERYEVAYQDCAALQNEVDRVQKRLRDVEDRFRREGGELYELRESLEAQRSAVEKELRIAEDRLRDIMSGASPLLLVRPLLAEIAEQGEREARVHRAMLLDGILAERDRALIAQAALAAAPADVLATLSQHLEEDRARRHAEAGGERYLHLSEESRLLLNGLLEGELSDRGHNAIVDALQYAREWQIRLDDVDRTLSRVPQEDAISSLLDELRDARTAYAHASARLTAQEEAVRQAGYEREVKQKRLDAAESAGADSRIEMETSARIVSHSRRVRETLERYRSSMVQRHVGRLQDLVLNSFQRLLRKERLVGKLLIDPKTFSIRLETPDGQPLSADRLSAGERQLLAVAILWGLGRAAGRHLPIVIDTPLGRLDSAHRANLLERYFPHAGHQVVLLSTDTEIGARGRSMLGPFLGVEHTLNFDETIGSTRVEPGYFLEPEAVHAN